MIYKKYLFLLVLLTLLLFFTSCINQNKKTTPQVNSQPESSNIFASIHSNPYLKKIKNISATYDSTSNTLILTWDFPDNAIFKIYKGSTDSNLTFIGKTKKNFFIDHSPSKENVYYYINAIYDNKESGLYKFDASLLLKKYILPEGFKISYDNPLPPDKGIWLKFEIYTLNKITPKSDYLILTLDLNNKNSNDSRFESAIVLKKGYDNFDDVTLYYAWIYYPENYYAERNSNINNFRIKRADGIYAQLFGTKDPGWIWSIWKEKNKPFYFNNVVQLDKNKYKFKTIIRQWEDSQIKNKKIKIILEPELNINTFTDVNLNFGGIFIQDNPNSSIACWCGNIPSVKYSNYQNTKNIIEYNIEYYDFASPETESAIGNLEYLLPSINKDLFVEISPNQFFTQNYTIENIVNTLSKNTIEFHVPMYINRIVKLKYEISDDGIFKNDIKEIKANTVWIRNDILREKLKYNEYLLEPNLIDFDKNKIEELYLYYFPLYNTVEFNPSSDDIEEIYSSKTIGINSITNFSESTLSMNKENYSSITVEKGLVIMYKTYSGKYIKIEFEDFYPMTIDEIKNLGIKIY
ncbi:hypothetical protein XO10_04880 [Marinitoga sp. 1135]|uniref:hypothetical protein n=1 Tax=unclassified Marinitoga TaxID=2640159 RepID=UPI0015868C6D|nr:MULTISPECIES: hypothetical protein [unclassified Marinitoga]NUU95613.1 hypothetical protein [Marinitoga sp. 1135]NUU97507.1 hypothetical protein [Marinitoga sp. 1138]